MKDPLHSADFEHDAVSKFMDEWARAVDSGGEYTMRPTCYLTRAKASEILSDDGVLFDLEPPSTVPAPPKEHPLWQPNKPA